MVRMLSRSLVAIVAIFFICSVPVCADTDAIAIKRAFSQLSFVKPVDLKIITTKSETQLFVVEQDGLIKTFNSNNANAKGQRIYLDLRSKVLATSPEQGLLGLAFPNNFESSQKIFVYYTRIPDGATVVSRFNIKDGAVVRDSEVILLVVDQPFSNHNGGCLGFGPDDLLYISLGDGGSSGDPQNHAQNLKSLLGKILRLDVLGVDSSLSPNYKIPRNNYCELQKLDSNQCRPEIYATGLRNVWRFSFDLKSDALWAADVGQNKYEEINKIRKPANFGWRHMEGKHLFNCDNCESQNLTGPVFEYGRDLGASITGGYVYQGKKIPELDQKYVFADFVSGRIMSISSQAPYLFKELLDTKHNIASFAEDSSGELYFLSYAAGQIFLIESNKKANAQQNY
jgi:glucose/arabinose dehydrogenase